MVKDGKLIVICSGLGSAYCNLCDVPKDKLNNFEYVERNWPFKITRNIDTVNIQYDSLKKSTRGKRKGKVITHTSNKYTY